MKETSERSAPALVGDLIGQTTELFRKEVQLLRAELNEKSSKAVAAVGAGIGVAANAVTAPAGQADRRRDTEDTANHLVGGALMGFGGVTAMGCTIGQGLSGVSTLAAGSFITVAAIVAGAVAALRYQGWRIERTS